MLAWYSFHTRVYMDAQTWTPQDCQNGNEPGKKREKTGGKKKKKGRKKERKKRGGRLEKATYGGGGGGGGGGGTPAQEMLPVFLMLSQNTTVMFVVPLPAPKRRRHTLGSTCTASLSGLPRW